MGMTVFIGSIETWTEPDHNADWSYLEQDEFADRLQQFKDGDVGFIGVRAAADVECGPISERFHASIWNVESDSSEDYLADLESELAREVRDQVMAFIEGEYVKRCMG